VDQIPAVSQLAEYKLTTACTVYFNHYVNTEADTSRRAVR